MDIQYKRDARNEDLLKFANCYTSIRYIVERAFGARLPSVWVGNLPFALTLLDWRIVSTDKLRPGDLLFVGREVGRICHILLALDHRNVFHCNSIRSASIEPIDDVLKIYRSNIRPFELFNKRDARKEKVQIKI